jgi:hypothetical protein
MAKSRARFLAELLGTDGLVKKAKSALAGADEVIDLSTLPSIPNSKLTNSSITINSSATSLGGSVTLTTANVAENTNLYYTDARADARVNLQTGSNLNLSSKNTGDLSEGSNLYYTDARADARIAAADTGDLSEGSNLYYTDARADARVALVVDSAPSTLNTLNELAAALGDDANFSTTVTNSIAAKLPLAGGAMTGNLTTNSRVAIGQSSVTGGNVLLDLHGSGNGVGAQSVYYNDHNTDGFFVGLAGNTTGNPIFYNVPNTNIEFYTNNAIAMTIASTGTTFAGTISSGAITSSASITASGNSNNFGNTTISNLSATAVTTSGSVIASGNSNSFGNTTVGTLSSGAITVDTGVSSGTHISLTKNSGTEIGRIGFTATDNVAIYGTTASHAGINFIGGAIIPMSGGTELDNAISLGDGSRNFSEIFAKGMTIGTTQIIDASRNLTNIGTITSTGVAALTRGNGSVGAPNTADHDTGTRIELYNANATAWYAIGIQSDTMWFNSDNHYRFYTDAVSKVDFDSSGVVNAVGGYKVNGTTVIDSSRNLTNIGTINSGDITTTGNIQTGSFDASYGVGKRTTVDMTSLNDSTWYPVIIPITPTRRSRVIIEIGLNSGSTPSWDTHPSGFTLHLDWTTVGSGWGTTSVIRKIKVWTEAWTTGQIAGSIGQMTNSSYEYVYLRGGGKYHFRISHGGTPSVKTSSFTANGQTVAPITSNIGTPWDGEVAHGKRKVQTLEASTSVTAPIFYDANNLAYYLNPADTGTSLNIAGGITTAQGTARIGPYGYNSANGVQLYGDTGRVFTDINYNSYGAEILLVNNRTANGISSLLQYRTNSVIEGSIQASGTGLVISNVSDYRKKENIRDLTGSLSVIKSLQPRVYEYREGFGSEGDHIGFIAHEIQAHIPKAVTGSKDAVYSQADIDEGATEVTVGDPKYQAVSYTHNEIITRLVQSIQELEARIAVLEA